MYSQSNAKHSFLINDLVNKTNKKDFKPPSTKTVCNNNDHINYNNKIISQELHKLGDNGTGKYKVSKHKKQYQQQLMYDESKGQQRSENQVSSNHYENDQKSKILQQQITNYLAFSVSQYNNDFEDFPNENQDESYINKGTQTSCCGMETHIYGDRPDEAWPLKKCRNFDDCYIVSHLSNYSPTLAIDSPLISKSIATQTLPSFQSDVTSQYSALKCLLYSVRSITHKTTQDSTPCRTRAFSAGSVPRIMKPLFPLHSQNVIPLDDELHSNFDHVSIPKVKANYMHSLSSDSDSVEVLIKLKTQTSIISNRNNKPTQTISTSQLRNKFCTKCNSFRQHKHLTHINDPFCSTTKSNNYSQGYQAIKQESNYHPACIDNCQIESKDYQLYC